MTRPSPDFSKPLPIERTLPGTIMRWIFIAAVVLATISGISAKLVHAGTLVQMPPHRYDGCKPKGSVAFRYHVGNVTCGGVSAPGCTYTRGKSNIIDLPSDVSACVLGKTRRHEIAHACGWPASHPGLRWEMCP